MYVEQRCDGLGGLVGSYGGRPVVITRVKVEPREERLIEQPPRVLVGDLVELMRLTEQTEKHRERLVSAVEIGPFDLVKLVFEASALVAQGAHALGELFLGPVGVADEVKEVILFPVDLGELLLHLIMQGAEGGDAACERRIHPCPDEIAELRRERDRGVVLGDSRFNVVYGQVRQVARALLTSPTDVVEVQIAALALAAHDDQPALAAITPHGALEVVVVGSGASSRTALHVEDFLNLVEQFRVDQRLVPPLVLDAFIDEITQVVAVTEHFSDLVDRDACAGRVVLVGLHAESGVGEHLGEILEAVGAGGVQLEGHAHEGTTFGVDGHRTDFAPLELLPDVEVAERGAAGATATGCLLAHLVADVGTGRAGLVLVDRVEDGPDEVADGGVLGVIGDGDQACPRRTEIPLGDRRVDGVAVHPGAAVDDHIVDVLTRFDHRHHALELGPVVHTGRGAPRLDELGDHVRAQLRCPSMRGGALGGK
nr:hypothetical protein [Planobispora rosea]